MMRCPGCAYDVSKQLARGMNVCPECGAEVDADLATHTEFVTPGVVIAAGYVIFILLYFFLSLYLDAHLDALRSPLNHNIAYLYAPLLVCVIGALRATPAIPEYRQRRDGVRLIVHVRNFVVCLLTMATIVLGCLVLMPARGF